MSIVACRVLENGYEIVSDSITVRGHTQTRENTKYSKLIEINGIVIGSVGSAEESSLFILFCSTRRPASATEYDILEFLSEFSEWKNKKIDDSAIENSYILGFDGKVFAVEHWLIEEVVTYEAIGAGMDFALAALYLGHSVKKAVETAIELSIFCESPVVTITKN